MAVKVKELNHNMPMSAEVEDELVEIKREMVESRALAIRTNTLTSSLGADLRSIARRQQSYERRISWNSATAYVVFVIVVFAGLKLAWDARVDQIREQLDARGADLARVQKELKESQKREEDRVRAETRSAQFYELLRQGRRIEAIEGWESMRKESLSKAELAAFGDLVERAKNEQASAAYVQALEKIHASRWQEALALLEEAQKNREDSPMALRIRLRVGECYRHLGRYKDAIGLLADLTENPADRDIHDAALYQLAHAQKGIGAWEDAKTSWRNLIRRFPESRYINEAKGELANLVSQH